MSNKLKEDLIKEAKSYEFPPISKEHKAMFLQLLQNSRRHGNIPTLNVGSTTIQAFFDPRGVKMLGLNINVLTTGHLGAVLHSAIFIDSIPKSCPVPLKFSIFVQDHAIRVCYEAEDASSFASWLNKKFPILSNFILRDIGLDATLAKIFNLPIPTEYLSEYRPKSKSVLNAYTALGLLGLSTQNSNGELIKHLEKVIPTI